MRRQDELICIYGGQSNLARKFLLSQMEGLALAFDSEELLEFLQSETGDPDPVVRGQALFSLAHFLTGYVQKRYALSEQSVGVWSTFGKDKTDVKAVLERGLDRSARIREVGQAALLATKPLAESLIASLDTIKGWTRTRAVLALGNFGLRRSEEWLSSAFRPPELPLEVGLALADLRGVEAESRIVSAVRESAQANPELFLLLGAVPGPASFSLLMDSIERTDVVGRMNLARALAGFSSSDVSDAFVRLCRGGEGWVVVVALNSLETLGKVDLLPRIAQVYRSAHHDFVRIQAVKSAGGIFSRDSIGFCVEALRSGSNAVRAVALESLVRLRADPKSLTEVATPLLTSPHLKAKVNAVLAALSPEEALVSPALNGLLMSTDNLSRLEAAYCLGYLQSKRALEFLGALANQDPALSVRQQAAKSLSKYPARDSLPVLIALLSSQEPRLALTAARVMTRYDGEEAAQTCEQISMALAQARRPFERALLYRALGLVCGKSQYPHARTVLAAGLDEKEPRVLAGVVEGWNLMGTAAEPSVVDRLGAIATGGEPRLSARALLALWHFGDLSAPERLGQLLASGDEKQVAPALECTMEIGLLLVSVAEGDRFPDLAAKLSGLIGSPGYEAFVGSEVDLGNSLSLKKANPRPDVDFDVRRQPRKPTTTARPKASSLPSVPSVSSVSSVSRPERPPSGVRLAARPPGPAQSAGPDSTNPGVGVNQLKTFLEKLGGENGATEGVKEALSRVTYLIADGLAQGAGLATLWASPYGKALIFSPVVVLLLVMLLRPSASGPGTVDRKFPGHLWVHLVQMPADRAGALIDLQDVIKPGDVVKTGKAGELILATPKGNQVRLGAESAVKLDGLDKGEKPEVTLYRFSEPRGDVVFEFRKDADLELRIGAARVSSQGAVLIIGRDVKGRALTIRSGRATYEAKGVPSVLRPGDSISLE